MYSRNFGTFENVSSVKLNNELKIRANERNNTVPVRNYSDNSAYERFNSLGNENKTNISTDEKIIEDKKTVSAEAIDNSSNENIIHENNERILTEDNNDEMKYISAENRDNKAEKALLSVFGDMHKITDIFDSDFLLIALAAALIFFGNNETNDKLTPIALLAIMFL